MESREVVISMKKLSAHETGMVLGAFLGLMHAGWALVVYLGFAQTWLDFILGLHFLKNPFVVAPFVMQPAVILVAVTAGVGYAAGFVFAKVWNLMMTKAK